MEKQRIISELLDGILPANNEEEIFTNLATDSNLRDEFRQQLNIKNSVKKDIKAFVPKAESTVKIFTKLGIASTLVSTATFGTRFAGFMSKYSQAIYATATTTAISLVAYFGLLSGGGFFNNSDISNNKLDPNNLASNLKSTAFIEDTIYTTKEIQKESSKIIYRDRYIYTNNPEKLSGNEKSLALADRKLVNDYNTHLNDEHAAEVINQIINANVNRINQNEVKRLNTLSTKPINLSNKINDNIFNPKQTTTNIDNPILINPDITPIFDFFTLPFNVNIETSLASLSNIDKGTYNFTGNNYRIATSIDVSEQWSVGFDLRRENHKLTDWKEDLSGDKVAFTSYPSFNFYSLTLRYSPTYLRYNKLLPFMQVSAGLSQDKGSIARIMLGTNYYITKNVSVLFGYNLNTFKSYVGSEGLRISNSAFQIGASYKIFKD